MRGHFITPCGHCQTPFEHHDSRRRFCSECSGVSRRSAPAVRFWAKVEKTDACWIWRAASHHGGYGVFKVGERSCEAHRVSYEMAYGPIPDNLCVLHRCDNPRCVRPDHLFLGTRPDNNADMVSKARQVKGEKSGKARLTEQQVSEIRKRYAHGVRIKQLALEYGLSYGGMSAIVHGRNWKHIV